MTRIDQFVPSFARHDAIGNHVLQLRRLLRSAGYESDIWYEHLDPRLAAEARPFAECDRRPDPERVILYHASTHSAMTDWLVEATAAGQIVVVYYHNITPAEYFAPWEPGAADSMRLGRRQLARLARSVAGGLANSAYSARELADLGVADPVPCPLLLDLSEYHEPPDADTAARLGGSKLWLFVGRLAPNKCQHDVIAAFSVYRRLYDPGSRLALPGNTTSARYRHALEQLASDLGVADAVEFPGSLPFPRLLAYFAAAEVFVCLSEHEGFCVPIVEAMELGLPVVAHSSSAVTETVADAGVLLDGKDPLEVAVAVHHLLTDRARRDAAIAAGKARAGEFSLARTSERWLAELGRYCAPQATTS